MSLQLGKDAGSDEAGGNCHWPGYPFLACGSRAEQQAENVCPGAFRRPIFVRVCEGPIERIYEMRNQLAQVNTQGRFAQHVSGPLAGIGMLCLMLAKNWAVLSIGWAVLACLILAGVVQRFRRTPVAGQPLFELGPLIWADLEKINRWLRPVAVFVLLLGLAGVLVSFGDEGPGHPGYAIFLIGTGVACLGIGKANRPLIIAGYALWTIAGAIVCYTALSIESSLASAQAITLGRCCSLAAASPFTGFSTAEPRSTKRGFCCPTGSARGTASTPGP